jgi:hypothetical protein
MTTGETYLVEARGLNEAVAILCNARADATLYAIGILAAHCLELALKAYLLHAGHAERDVKAVGHDLATAWKSCKQSGLALKELHYWVQVLNYSHASPYFFRYPRDDHKVAIPSTDELAKDIHSVLELISSAMKGADAA